MKKITGNLRCNSWKDEKRQKKVRIFAILLCVGILLPGIYAAGVQTTEVQATASEPAELYAQSAVLMDADSGRILFEKNGHVEKAMASTTKIMTCILALENGNPDDVVTASSEAASQPEVHLGVRKGEQFRLRDLLYSLMLESHNDSAVMIAERIGKSEEGFAVMMNEKAAELGCEQTHFITPNGLDAEDEMGSHHTTAADLAKIMKYCIMDSPQKNKFLEITGTAEYQFTDISGARMFSCRNHNSFLQMMEGALSGKTGFTGDAGYCYVGALRREKRTFIVALLACGWPNNKSYKWSDTRKLMNYGLENYEYRKVWKSLEPGRVPVENGLDRKNEFLSGTDVGLQISGADMDWNMLLRDDEAVSMTWETEEELEAPVTEGEKAGEVQYWLNGELIRTFDITVSENVGKREKNWYILKVLESYLL